MGPLGFVIAILGCADGGAGCQTVATLSARYDSAAECALHREDALNTHTDLDFPTLIAECRSSRAIPAAIEAPRDRVRGRAA